MFRVRLTEENAGDETGALDGCAGFALGFRPDRRCGRSLQNSSRSDLTQ